MNARKAKLKWTLLAGLVCLLAAGRADAAQTCTTDLDCPDSACGGMVCVRSSGVFACANAGERGTPRADGWCADPVTGMAVDSNCKCAAQGAICDGFYCTFTMMPGTGGSGGATGAGGSGTGGSGTAGASGGTSAGTGGGDGGGCSVAGAPALGGTAGIALLLAALLRRRGRRAR